MVYRHSVKLISNQMIMISGSLKWVGIGASKNSADLEEPSSEAAVTGNGDKGCSVQNFHKRLHFEHFIQDIQHHFNDGISASKQLFNCWSFSTCAFLAAVC